MSTTRYTQTNDSNGTANLMHLLNDRDQQVLRLIFPRDVEKAFGTGDEIDIPDKGYTDPEWYFRSSDGAIWGIGWRYGRTRLRGRGATSRGNFFYETPSPEAASEFVSFLVKALDNG